MRSVGSFLPHLLDLVLPAPCIGCRGPNGPVCAACTPRGRPIAVPGPVPVFAAGAYEGALRRVVLAYKERDRRDAAAWLAGRLTVAVRAVLAADRGPPAGVVLVPVPSSSAARAQRGGDHLRPLARRVGGQCGLPVAADALRLVRRARDSAGLTVAERAANLAGAMSAGEPVRGTEALVVDDVVTTGASIGEAVRALRAAGWPVIGAATVASTPRRTPRRTPLAALEGRTSVRTT